MVGRNVRRWSGRCWRGLRSVVVLLMRLTRRGCRRRRGGRQILQLSGLGRLVVHVPRRERWRCLEVLVMDGRVRREHLDGTRHQRLTGGCCDLNLGGCWNWHFPDARLSRMRVLLCRLECGLRLHHVRHVDLLMRGHVLLGRIVALRLLLLRLLLLLHHRTGRLRGVWARRRVTRRVRSARTARCKRLGRGVQSESLFRGHLCRTVHVGASCAGIPSRAVLTLVANTRTVGTTITASGCIDLTNRSGAAAAVNRRGGLWRRACCRLLH